MRLLVLFLVTTFFTGVLFAQNEKDRLQSDKNRLEREIEYTNLLLDETQRSKQITMNQLVLLNRKIRQREELINALNNEIGIFDAEIQNSGEIVLKLKNQISDMKQEYARMIYSANRHRKDYDRLMFIFAADDFNQAYKRMRYLQQYGKFRKMQSEKIIKTQQELNDKIAQLEVRKAEKLALRAANDKERKQLAIEQNQQNQGVKKLSQKEKYLIKTLRENELAIRRLQKAIEDLIVAEMRKATEAAVKSGEKAPMGFALTPEEVMVSDNFASNKGKLPWPSERGLIASSFGEHPHPVLKGIKTQNNGIDIATHKGAAARSVFEGVVSNVLTIPSLNNVVIIKHGEFLTVYSNLDQVFVKKGDSVKPKQVMGIVHTDDEQARTRLHFEIWKGKELLDPEHWIVKNNVAQYK
ncbi:MAG: peptidoglycan DD-metalloendopeptidase family protein [Bacteroidales bacterium]|nr:peptidoglycan DD-metalloendopeptidase family protein [Bacteroidales bacterium]MDZ4205348.1 peptidoglycan DD-metalloendopeptidase family protein [Bacteroidales bacterium]